VDLQVRVEGAQDPGGQGRAGVGEGFEDTAGFGGHALLPVRGDDPGQHRVAGRAGLVGGDSEAGADRDGVRVVGVQRAARCRYRPAALVEDRLDEAGRLHPGRV
jgi:hypothetical protein